MNHNKEMRVARLGAVDMLAMIWREKRTGLATGLAILAVASAAIFLTPERPEAQAQLFVGLTAAGPRAEDAVKNELRLLASPEVAQRTIARIGLKRLYPRLASEVAVSPPRALAAAERAFARDFTATAVASVAPEPVTEGVTAPGTAPVTSSFAEPVLAPVTGAMRSVTKGAVTGGAPVVAPANATGSTLVSLAFVHADRQIAVQTLDALTAEYLAYRRRLLGDPLSAGYAVQAQDFSRRAAAAAGALQAWRARSGVADFEGELQSATGLLARLDSDMAAATAERATLKARAASLRERLASEPALIDLFADTDAENRPGVTRRGVNPVRQALQTELFDTEAGVRAQIARQRVLTAQKAALGAKVRALQDIEPQYRDLVRVRAVLDDNARLFSARAETAQALGALRMVDTDAIRQMGPARVARPNNAARIDLIWLALVAAIGGAVGSALLRGLGRLSFPTPSSASRTLGAPVLGVALQRRAA